MSNRLNYNYNRRDVLKFGAAAAVGTVVLTACGESQPNNIGTGRTNIEPDAQEAIDVQENPSSSERDVRYIGAEELNPDKFFGLPEEEIREVFSIRKGVDSLTNNNFEALTDNELIDVFEKRMNIIANLARSEQYLQESKELGYRYETVGYSQYAIEKYINPALDGGLFAYKMEDNNGVLHDTTKPIEDLKDLLGYCAGQYQDIMNTVETLGKRNVPDEIVNDIPDFVIDSSEPLPMDGFTRGFLLNYTFSCESYGGPIMYKGVMELGINDSSDKYDILLSRFSKKSQG